MQKKSVKIDDYDDVIQKITGCAASHHLVVDWEITKCLKIRMGDIGNISINKDQVINRAMIYTNRSFFYNI